MVANVETLKPIGQDFIHLLRTSQTYKTRAAALKKLEREIGEAPVRVPYVIAVNEEGRFAPVVFGVHLLPLIHRGITVVG